MDSVENNQQFAERRQRLVELRERLLHLHKALIDSERVGYELVFGSVGSAVDLLQLLTRDPWFAWLRPVSELIVRMDETLDGPEPITAELLDGFLKTARTLFTPAENGDDFATHYSEALQRDPNVILAHGDMVKSFPPPKRPS